MSRLIDAEALKKEIADLVVGGEKAIDDTGYGNSWINGIHSCFRCIDNAPTVEQPKGHIVNHHFCSECGSGIPTDVYGGGVVEEEVNFCFSCGARLRKEAENETDN